MFQFFSFYTFQKLLYLFYLSGKRLFLFLHSSNLPLLNCFYLVFVFVSVILLSVRVCTDDPHGRQNDENDAADDDDPDAYHVTPSLVIAETSFQPVLPKPALDAVRIWRFLLRSEAEIPFFFRRRRREGLALEVRHVLEAAAVRVRVSVRKIRTQVRVRRSGNVGSKHFQTFF
jgi:hypothetical protein